MRKVTATVVWMLAIAIIPAASGEEQARLPAGRYIYLGSDPNSSTPKAFTVTPEGSIIWLTELGVTVQPSTSKADLIWNGATRVDVQDSAAGGKGNSPAESNEQRAQPGLKAQAGKIHLESGQAAKSVQTGMENIEIAEWPVIKFVPKPIPESKDGFAQLTTMLDTPNGGWQTVVKYKLILLHADPVHITVQLLDGKGFMLHEFRVYPNQFQPIAGTSLVAARGQFSLSVQEYRKARDFSIAVPTSPTAQSEPTGVFPYRMYHR